MDSINPYCERTYRKWSGRNDLETFCVGIETSDLRIQCDRKRDGAARAILAKARGEVEEAIRRIEGFGESFDPVEVPAGAEPIVSSMAAAARAWGVGPMAAVAGAIAHEVASGLLRRSREVIVENGGDLFLRCDGPATVGLYAGEESPFAGRLAFEVDARPGVAVCTSSGVVGPSLSLGRADAVMTVSRSGAVADAAATSIANRIARPADVDDVVAEVARAESLDAVVACCGDRLGVWGDIELVSGGAGRDRR